MQNNRGKYIKVQTVWGETIVRCKKKNNNNILWRKKGENTVKLKYGEVQQQQQKNLQKI